MSNTQTPPPSPPRFLAAIMATIGGFAVFAVTLVVAYVLRDNHKPILNSTSELIPVERKTRLKNMQVKEMSAATTYSWLDPEKTMVRIPIERAMELTIQEINSTKEKSQRNN